MNKAPPPPTEMTRPATHAATLHSEMHSKGNLSLLKFLTSPPALPWSPRNCLQGLDNRHRRFHSLNSESSRSHAIFSVYLDILDSDADKPTRYGRVSLLDLAGAHSFAIRRVQTDAQSSAVQKLLALPPSAEEYSSVGTMCSRMSLL